MNSFDHLFILFGGPLKDLRDFIKVLKSEDDLIEIKAPVDPDLELAEIHRRVVQDEGKALLFSNVKGSSFRVVSNLFGSEKRIQHAVSNEAYDLEKILSLLEDDFPPGFKELIKNLSLFRRLLKIGTKSCSRKKASVCEIAEEPKFNLLPFTKSWPLDGGSFLTLPLVMTKHPGTGRENLGIYRMQRYSDNETGIHWQIDKGGGFHFYEAKKNGVPLEVAVLLGGHPALTLASIAPLPENVPELILASFLMGSKITTVDIEGFKCPSECEFILRGQVDPFTLKPEGPFGDHYGFYSLAHDFPVFKCHQVYRRKDALFPVTVVGKPKQEDFYIGNFLQSYFSSILKRVMPSVIDLWSYGETGFHCLTAARVKERYSKEAMKSGFRILGEGQLSLTKILFLLNTPLNLRDIKSVIVSLLERTDPRRDLFILSNLALDTLDYSGPKLNEGSRLIWMGLGDIKRSLPESFEGEIPRLKDIKVFCPGCLLIQLDDKDLEVDLEELCRAPSLKPWPLIILCDDVKESAKDQTQFLWNTFIHFDPDGDIYSANKSIIGNHISYQFPILFDSRHKESFPEPVECSDEVKELVDQRWSEYF